MGKKKNKSQIINHIQEMNLEIDYDKLAEAIAKAVNASESQNTNEEDSFIDEVIDGKIPKGKLFSRTLSKILQAFFYLLAIGSVILVVYFALLVGVHVHNAKWNEFMIILDNIGYIATAILLALLDVIFVIFTWKIGTEIGEDRDKNYIVSSFSCVVSLVALIVALVALFKGVG